MIYAKYYLTKIAHIQNDLCKKKFDLSKPVSNKDGSILKFDVSTMPYEKEENSTTSSEIIKNLMFLTVATGALEWKPYSEKIDGFVYDEENPFEFHGYHGYKDTFVWEEKLLRIVKGVCPVTKELSWRLYRQDGYGEYDLVKKKELGDKYIDTLVQHYSFIVGGDGQISSATWVAGKDEIEEIIACTEDGAIYKISPYKKPIYPIIIKK